MRDITVHVPGEEYRVAVGAGLLQHVGERALEVTSARKVALVTDVNVAALFGTTVDTSLARAGFDVVSMSVPAGEASKSWTMAGDIVEALAAARLGREDLVVALGGGVVGDLAGFAASVYLRGIALLQVPTTLLAMVDSSVGGKTAVDLRAGKNLAGAFKQPGAVIADTDTLAQLPEHEWRSGLAEAAKSAVLDSAEFLSWLEHNAEMVGRREPRAVEELVARCVAFKAGVVARDEKEEGPRECLNYGHTLGHAIELLSGYGTYTHGAAVAEGMRFAARVAVDLGCADTEFVRRQDALLDALGLSRLDTGLAPEEVLSAMHGDKKARGGELRMVFAHRAGEWSCRPVPDETVLAHLRAWSHTKGELRS